VVHNRWADGQSSTRSAEPPWGESVISQEKKGDGVKMAKFMLSVSGDYLKLLQDEANERNCSIQELIRAVILPEHFRDKAKRIGEVAQGQMREVPRR